MADVFISYARADKARVAPLVAAIEARGWTVWWDPEITPGREFDDEIDVALQAAKAVLVVWTPTSVASRWVRGEARDAAERGILVPVRFDQARLPIDVRAIHTTDLDGWSGDSAHAAAQECLHALGATIARSQSAEAAKPAGAPAAPTDKKSSPRYTICVLPFANMSGDPDQEYFSDGITEDIITDLSKVSSLRIISRNSAFQYKGEKLDLPQLVREMKITHVLEGSVRKAGGRVRISAQLVDCEDSGHIWAERYDRDTSDIFAIQDEISKAIVKALRLRLLPEEKKAIERRGTDSADAYNFYLLARQTYVSNQELDERPARAIVSACKRATDIDPNYAQAWAMMATGYKNLRQLGVQSADGMDAAERALALDPNLAEAHAVKAQILQTGGDLGAAAGEVAVALSLNPDSYEVNRAAGRLYYESRKFDDAIRYYEKAVALMEADIHSAAMLISCYTATGDTAGRRRSSELTLKRSEAVLARDQGNPRVIGFSVDALAALGEAERAKARMEHSLLFDPDNWVLRWQFACSLNVQLKEKEAALEMLVPVFEMISESMMAYIKADPDFDSLRDDPRWQTMVIAAEARLAAAKAAVPATVAGD